MSSFTECTNLTEFGEKMFELMVGLKKMCVNLNSNLICSDTPEDASCNIAIGTSFLHIVSDFFKSYITMSSNKGVPVLEDFEYLKYLKRPRPVSNIKSFGAAVVQFLMYIVSTLEQYYRNAKRSPKYKREADLKHAAQFLVNFLYKFLLLTLGPFINTHFIQPEFMQTIAVMELIKDSKNSI